MAITLARPETRIPEGQLSDDSDVGFLPSRKRFTRDEYHLLPPEVFQRPGRKYELIVGDIIEKMGRKEPHIGLLMDLLYAIGDMFGRDYVRGQMPIVVSSDTELEPDISVAVQTNRAYRAAGLTTPATDVRFVVEISASTLAYDTTAKAYIYARRAIAEYWALNVAERSLIVHRDPTPDGYANVRVVAADETIAPLARPEATFKVSDYLP